MLPVHANREVYDLRKDGVKAQYRDDRDEEITRTVRLVDWRNPAARANPEEKESRGIPKRRDL
jgi:type I site-specific restriction-modification system R (restriction) subunit